MKKINFIKVLIIVITFFFTQSVVNGSTGSYSQTVSISRHGSSASSVINTPPFGTEKQVYSVDISGTYDGHGALGPSGGKYGISVCINSGGGMWTGSCWNVVDANGAGNIGDASGSIPNNTVSIGATSNNFNYVSADVYVNDADASVNFNMNGREVSINGFNTTNSTMAVGGQFDITWNATERTGDSVLSYSGPVSCDIADGASVAGDTNGTTCTGTAVGTATFNLQATGYGGYGTKNVNSQPINVAIVSPPVNCGNNIINAGEQCDTGVNNGSCPRACSNSCTVNSCGGTISTLTFTASGPGTAMGYSSTGAGQPLTYIGSCRNATCSLPLPTNTYVTIDAVHDTTGGPFVWTPLCPASGVGIRCEGLLNANYSAGVTFTGVTTPTTNNVTISSPMVTPNGTTQYTISHTGADTGGSSKITYQYALLRDGNGINKGWFAWTSVSAFTGHKNPMACTGGGYGAILSAGGWAGYGDQYVRLISCNTTNTSNSRTVNFVMVFEPAYSTTVTNNDIDGITYNSNNNYSPWEHFDINFGLNMPTINSVTISPSPVTTNNSTQHTITAVAYDPTAGTNVSQVYALTNIQGANAGTYRGYLTWGSTDWWPSDKNHIACTGGGWAVIQSTGGNTGFGHGYVNLDSCSTSTSGNNRTVNFVVRYDPSFTTPTTGNVISGHVYNLFGHPSGWIQGSLFDLLVPTVPTVTTPTVSGITTTGATLGANVTSLGVPAAISARGTCWGTVNPPVTNCTPASGLTTGVFTHARTGMPSGTTIYYRGYATNTTGTGYSTVSSFTTTSVPAPTLSASPSSIAPGGTVTVTFANVPTPTVRDWIGMYILGNTGNSFLDWKYEGVSPCTQTVPGSSRSSGSCTFTAPVTPGNYNFRLWDNDNILVQHAVSNTVTVTAPSTYTLTVNVNPVNGGRITGPGINCGADCSESVSAGSNITLTAVPSSSYWKFTGWSGACSGTSTTCNITVNADTSVTANFVARSFIYKEF